MVPAEFEKRVQWLQAWKRPILCTEYMARPNGSTFQAILPIAKKYNVAMINWGFVNGKSQTNLPWDSWQKPYTDREPACGSTTSSRKTGRLPAGRSGFYPPDDGIRSEEQEGEDRTLSGNGSVGEHRAHLREELRHLFAGIARAQGLDGQESRDTPPYRWRPSPCGDRWALPWFR